MLVKEERLLHLFIKCLHDFFIRFSHRVQLASDINLSDSEQADIAGFSDTESKTSRRLVLDCSADILHREESPWERLISDFQSTVSNPGVGEIFLFEDKDLYKKWLEVLALVQGIGPNFRKTGAHVEYETEEWRIAFFVDWRILDVIFPLSAELGRIFGGTSKNKMKGKEKEELEYEMETSFDTKKWEETRQLLQQTSSSLIQCAMQDNLRFKTIITRKEGMCI